MRSHCVLPANHSATITMSSGFVHLSFCHSYWFWYESTWSSFLMPRQWAQGEKQDALRHNLWRQKEDLEFRAFWCLAQDDCVRTVSFAQCPQNIWWSHILSTSSRYWLHNWQTILSECYNFGAGSSRTSEFGYSQNIPDVSSCHLAQGTLQILCHLPTDLSSTCAIKKISGWRPDSASKSVVPLTRIVLRYKYHKDSPTLFDRPCWPVLSSALLALAWEQSNTIEILNRGVFLR